MSREQHPVATVVGRVLDTGHEISILSRAMTYPLRAYASQLDSDTNSLALHVFCAEHDLERYLTDDRVSFDIERRRQGETLEILSFDQLPAFVTRQQQSLHEIRCLLPRSVLITERRGGIRIPFLQGMQARAVLRVFPGGPDLDGLVRNLSAGGCLVDVGIAEAAVLAVDQHLNGIRLVFPNGEAFDCEAVVRHLRPVGSSRRVLVGLEFLLPVPALREQLQHLVHECERELAYRTGMQFRAAGISTLFVPDAREQTLREKIRQSADHTASGRQFASIGVEVIARQLQVILLALRSDQGFPEAALYECADTLLHLLDRDRRALMYSLSWLREDPGWVRQAVQVAAHLADLVTAAPGYTDDRRDAVVGALLHTLGKPLLLSEALPSLSANLTHEQRSLLRDHVGTLMTRLDAAGWKASPVAGDLMAHVHECLDGSGYPAGLGAEALSPLVRAASVVRVINRLTHPRNGSVALTPMAAYRWVYQRPETYDRDALRAYVRRQGFYPVGQLALFSKGFLAWIQQLDRAGRPIRVLVVKNLAYRDANLNTVLQHQDLQQLGTLERIVYPEDYGISLRKRAA